MSILDVSNPLDSKIEKMIIENLIGNNVYEQRWNKLKYIFSAAMEDNDNQIKLISRISLKVMNHLEEKIK
jgi:hypothetical protein